MSGFTKVVTTAIVVLAVLVTGLALLTRQPRGEYTVAATPFEGAVSQEEHYAPIVDYLSGCTGKTVNLYAVESYNTAIEAMRFEHVNVGRFGPLSYVLAAREAGADAIGLCVKAKSGQPTYRAVIIALAGNDVNLREATFAYVDVSSTSGHLAPSVYFKEQGWEPRKTYFAGSHDAVIEALRNGAADAGATGDVILSSRIAEGKVQEGEFDILWESDPIPSAVWAVSGSMDAGMRDALAGCLFAAPSDVVEIIGSGDIAVVPGTDVDFAPVRRLLELSGE